MCQCELIFLVIEAIKKYYMYEGKVDHLYIKAI